MSVTGPELTAEVLDHAAVLWDYHRIAPDLGESDIILGLGNHDPRVPAHAAGLWHAEWAPLVVFTGGRGKITESWSETEADVFARIAVEHGVPSDAIVLERTATNTGENIQRTRALLRDRGIRVRSGILVTKPYMARRAFATAARQWPEVAWLVSTPALTLAEYLATDPDPVRSVELMVGDLQRVEVYARLGFQIAMSIPDDVRAAYEKLVAHGFDRYVLV
jgi:uncharacterized SAM-binding protein YcdF (DUF218 family)